MRISTIDERRRFYSSEFDVKGLSAWIGARSSQMKFAMILGRHTGVVSPTHSANKNDIIVIDDWRTASDLKAYALDYLPESMYYDRNRYADVRDCVRCAKGGSACSGCRNYRGQQLAFDLDPENVDCPYHGHIGEKIQKGRGLSFCMYEFKAVRKQAVQLSQSLSDEFCDVGVVYSGRGFHVVVDDESSYMLKRRERIALAKRYGRRFAIDEWVTIGDSRLLRLPYSLNSLVSRKCLIIEDVRELRGFDPRIDPEVIPRFLRLS